MGAGVALAFKTRYPAMFRDYKKACDAGDVRPGTLNIWRTLTEWIINFPTKRHWRENSRYEDIEAGLKALRVYLDSLGKSVRVALPALGCGHGGLDWPRVSKLIENYLEAVDAEIFVFEPADSVRVGEMSSTNRKGNGRRGEELTPRTLRPDETSFPRALRHADVNSIAVVGDALRLSQPMVVVSPSEAPDPRELEAARDCVEALARAHVQLSFIVKGSGWRHLAQLAVARDVDILLWCVDPIRLEALQLQKELESGHVTVASLARDGDVWTQPAMLRTTRAALEVSRAQLITDSQPVPMVDTAMSRSLRLFFIRYASLAGAVDRLLELGASPIGRSSNNRSPNIAPILDALRSAKPDDSDQRA
jgi:O-acetyl-ADP-ribose deacetylase (regulator of RNase III)